MAKSKIVQLWMGQEAYQVVKMWTAESKLNFTNEGFALDGTADPTRMTDGFKVARSITLLDEYFKPKGNRLFTIRDLWSSAMQGDLSMHNWITKIHILVAECDTMPDP